MNHDNHNKTMIDHTLERSADAPVPPAVEARLRARLAGFRQKLEGETSARSSHRRHWILRISVGAAAVIALGFALWISLSPTITLADVQAAIEKHPWVHIVFDNGNERWTSLAEHKSYFKGSNGSLRVIDYTANKEFKYKPELGKIEKKTFVLLPDGYPDSEVVRLAPKHPLDFTSLLSQPLMDIPDGGVPVQLKQDLGYVEKHSETLDGRRLLRFDWYCKDRMERTYLSWQIWVDPQTRLPVSSRSRMMRDNLMSPDDAFTVGRYDFPDTGPKDIYALGAPRDVPVIDPYEPSTEEIKQCLDAIKEADNRWPERYRVIQWPVDDQLTSKSYEFYVSWWDGKPKGRYMRPDDYRGVKLRSERLVNFNPKFDEKHRDDYLPMPTTAERILEWRKEQTPERIQVSDGEEYVTFRKPYPREGGSSYGKLTVGPIPDLMGYMCDERPGYYLWPCADMRPPANLRSNGPDLKPGTVMLWGRGARFGQDFHIDPAHDMICIKRVWWGKRGDEWVKQREHEVLEFDQLPSGQWYASKHKLTIYDDPENRTHGYSVTWNVDMKVLEEDGFPPDTFNGQKMLKEAKADGARIETR